MSTIGSETIYKNPTQVVEFQNVWSTADAVSLGVPQGFTLGPLLVINHVQKSSLKIAFVAFFSYTCHSVNPLHIQGWTRVSIISQEISIYHPASRPSIYPGSKYGKGTDFQHNR